MENKKKIAQITIEVYQKFLKRYKSELEKHPNSMFYLGLVKNTEEYIEELKKKI